MDADCFLCIKYYVAEPCTLREELTRYFFFLQVKRDIFQGRYVSCIVMVFVSSGLLRLRSGGTFWMHAGLVT